MLLSKVQSVAAGRFQAGSPLMQLGRALLGPGGSSIEKLLESVRKRAFGGDTCTRGVRPWRRFAEALANAYFRPDTGLCSGESSGPTLALRFAQALADGRSGGRRSFPRRTLSIRFSPFARVGAPSGKIFFLFARKISLFRRNKFPVLAQKDPCS